jgi:hypothetical protein
VIYRDDRSALFGRDGSPIADRVRETHAKHPPAREADESAFP